MRPCLLIASPQMRDPNFRGTVVLLLHHDEEGALGLVVNREGRVAVRELLDDELARGDHPSLDRPAWWGGPVAEGMAFVVFRGRADPASGWTVGGDVAVTQSVEDLRRLLADGAGFFLVLGYSGWGPGQLDAEIEGGSWLVADIDAELVFSAPMAERYDRALAQLGLTASGVWMNPVYE